MNFVLILTLATLFTGVMWVIEIFKWRPSRRAKADAAAHEFETVNREAIDRGNQEVIAERNALYQSIAKQPWWLEYTADLFPVLAVIFVMRSFLWEPFRIPSGSMLPTLYIGDFILVNKYSYGLRLPVLNKEVIPIGTPKRGDVVVFKYPMDTNVDYIKRVIGVPGDEIRYLDKVLYVNGVRQEQRNERDWDDPSTFVKLTVTDETVGGVEHMTAVDDRAPAGLRGMPYDRALNDCQYYSNGFVCRVPENHYFMMGDNRDNSEDSRYWGMVPHENLVGRAFLIWANFGDMTRVGSFK